MTIYPVNEEDLISAIDRLNVHCNYTSAEYTLCHDWKYISTPGNVHELNRLASRLCDYRFRLQHIGGTMYITDVSLDSDVLQSMYDNNYLERLNDVLEQAVAKYRLPYIAEFVNITGNAQAYGFQLNKIGCIDRKDELVKVLTI